MENRSDNRKKAKGGKTCSICRGRKVCFFTPEKILKTHGDIAWEMDIPQKRNYLTLEKQFAIVTLPIDFSERGGVYENVF